MKWGFRKTMNLAAVILTITFAALLAAHRVKQSDLLLTLCITLGTTAYHFVMRLAVGGMMNTIRRKPYNPHNMWFSEKPFERRLYKALGVRRWKNTMPTYDPGQFDMEKNPLSQLADNSCHAELVHEIIIAAGYLSLLFELLTPTPGDSLLVFIITATAAGFVDLMFVIMQRYNRPRLLRLAAREKL